jgi:hypothetical protein
MALFTATQAGAMSTAATFGGAGVPGATDDVEVAGYALTQGTVAQLKSLVDTTGGGTLTLTGSFTCPDVQEVPLVVPDGVTATISFGTSGVDPGCQYSESGYAIECQSGGTVTNVVGDIENTGEGYGLDNDGTVTDFSGSLVNSGAGNGVFNNFGTVTDFSGSLVNSGAGMGFWNGATVSDFSGTLTNTGTGTGFSNEATVYAFSGTCLDSGLGVAFANLSGSLYAITGIIGRPSSQTDLAAENIVAGKTILGVLGTWDYPQTTTLAVALRSAVGMAAADLDDQLAAIKADTAAIAAYGDGDTAVDHNTGGTDALLYSYGGTGIDNGTIRAYLKSDYDAGTYTLRGQTVTGSDGRWAKPMYLNSGLTYTLTFEKAGAYGVTEQEVTIP